MLGLVLTLLVAQAPAAGAPASHGVVVLVVRDQGLSAIESSALADQLSSAFAGAGIPLALDAKQVRAQLGKKSPKSCRGKPACLAELGRGFGASAVVALDTGKLLDSIPVRVQVLDAADGRVLMDRLETVTSDKLGELDSFFERVAREAATLGGPVAPSVAPSKMASTPPPQKPSAEPGAKPSDAPRTPVLVPRDSGPSDVEIVTSEPSSLPRVLVGWGAGASGVASLTFLGVGLYHVSQLNSTQPDHTNYSTQTYAQAQQSQQSANTSFLLSGLLAGAAVALGVTALAMGGGGEPAK